MVSGAMHAIVSGVLAGGALVRSVALSCVGTMVSGGRETSAMMSGCYGDWCYGERSRGMFSGDHPRERVLLWRVML